MNTLPVYVVTGFLDAGKTSLLNILLNRRDWKDVRILVIQFEAGEEEFQSQYSNCHNLAFPKKVLEQQPKLVIEQIRSILQNHKLDELWIEWNGVIPFSQLQSLLLDSSLRTLCKIKKVIHLADAANIENLLGRTGAALPEQIASSDFVVVRGIASAKIFKRIRHLIRGINPGVNIYQIKDYDDLCQRLLEERDRPVSFFFLLVSMLAALYFIAAPVLEDFQIPVNAFTNVFLGIILQAIPFLLVGILLSSAIQVFIPQSAIERRFPKSLGAGMLVAIIGGFCLPVCDCASIPIFRSLVKKGIPLPVAVTFMTATPVINPVVILSTYYAFGGNMRIVAGRVCYGIIASLIIGLTVATWPPKGQVLSGGVLDRLMCSCGCYEAAESVTTFKGKVGLFLRHSQAEFFNVGKYLVIGTFIASIFQFFGTKIFTTAQDGAGLVVSILIMMVMAFVLSLCSSSDAVIARSLAKQFPTSAIMGFLVFGPMMDIKNVMMLSSGFSKRFIGRLLIVTFIVCFALVFYLPLVGGI
ncbi:MAG TPA: permease [Clostridiales bacterium]|nr:permease [Clostridiales bacterium]